MKFVLVAILSLGSAAPLAAQERTFGSGAAVRESGSVATARELYASARYDEALSVLNGLLGGDRSASEVKVIEQYRSLCLLALGRADEAEAAIAAVVTADPFYKPSEEEASPRVRNTFSEVRDRLLPGLATTRYAVAKRSYDEKDWEDAKRQFADLITLLDDPQMRGRAGDLRVLAQGFLDLATAAATPPPAPAAAAPAPVEPPPAPAVPARPTIYTGDEPGVVVPVTIRQEMPPVPASIMTTVREKGLLDIVIDEQGRVASMALRGRVHPVYDSLVLSAARDWKYRPATMNGKPVQFRKLIQFTVKK
jgi:hypothetical protein